MSNYEYQVGGSLTIESPCYVLRQADLELYELLNRGEFCYVLNSRQMGKSSLLVRTRHRLQKEGYRCTTIDMTRIGSENITPDQWYNSIVTELCRGFKLLGKVDLKVWWHEEKLSVSQRLSNFIEHILLLKFPQEKIFIFIDEIDSIKSLDFPIDDFFALIKFCYNNRASNPEYNRLTFALFGLATPLDLSSDQNRTPFNIGTAIDLQGFQLHEAVALAPGLSAKIANSQIALKEILAWTGGQPFLTQKLCQLVVNASQREAIIPGNEAFWIESLVRIHLIYKWESQDEPEHLRTIRDRLLSQEERAGRLLSIYQRILQGVDIETNDSREQIELLLSGLVVKQHGLLKIQNFIYQEVFNLSWVEKQLRTLCNGMDQTRAAA